MASSFTVEHTAQLLAFLFASCPEVKKTKVRKWLKHGVIQVNGNSVTRFDHPLQVGDVVTIRDKAELRVDSILPTGLNIVFEDAAILVIEKPANLLSMANETERDKTAYAALTDYVRRGNRQAKERIWIVHRLDREASGLMVFAKTKIAKQTLQNHWDETDKRYLALVEGNLPDEHGTLKSHLDESGPFKVYSAQPSDRTRLAVTHYRVVQRFTKRTLIELTLETGRRNQIRVQLAEIKCPIIGDHKYEARTNPARRLGLHSSSLQFQHPVTGEPLEFTSPLPPELAQLV